MRVVVVVAVVVRYGSTVARWEGAAAQLDQREARNLWGGGGVGKMVKAQAERGCVKFGPGFGKRWCACRAGLVSGWDWGEWSPSKRLGGNT